MMTGWVYLSFFFVQLHLKYIVSIDVVNVRGQFAIDAKKQSDDPSKKFKGKAVKLKLNKRYQPEPLCAPPSLEAQLIHLQPGLFTYQEDTYPSIAGGSPLLLSLRGPPAC